MAPPQKTTTLRSTPCDSSFGRRASACSVRAECTDSVPSAPTRRVRSPRSRDDKLDPAVPTCSRARNARGWTVRPAASNRPHRLAAPIARCRDRSRDGDGRGRRCRTHCGAEGHGRFGRANPDVWSRPCGQSPRRRVDRSSGCAVATSRSANHTGTSRARSDRMGPSSGWLTRTGCFAWPADPRVDAVPHVPPGRSRCSPAAGHHGVMRHPRRRCGARPGWYPVDRHCSQSKWWRNPAIARSTPLSRSWIMRASECGTSCNCCARCRRSESIASRPAMTSAVRARPAVVPESLMQTPDIELSLEASAFPTPIRRHARHRRAIYYVQ